MSNIVMGINYVRPPVINITKKNVTKDYTKYEIETKHKSKYKLNENDYINYLDSFIFCKDKLTIRVPTKKFCKRNGKSKFAYVVGLFPNPKTGKATYLDGCILCALGLRRQKTNADIICMVTPDIQSNDISKLEFDIALLGCGGYGLLLSHFIKVGIKQLYLLSFVFLLFEPNNNQFKSKISGEL